MAGLETILNGTFDFDPSAEKVRISFDKVNRMFTEIYGKVPLTQVIAGNAGLFLKVNAAGDAFELSAVPGGGDMLGANNLNDVASPSQARTNLGLGSAAESSSDDFATGAQGDKADTALQSIGNGGGVTIDTTDPQNPTISFDGQSVTGMTINPANGVITLAVTGASDITLDMSQYLTLLINGLHTIKGAGNVNFTTHENGDKAFGWEGDEFIAFKQVSGQREYAVQNSI